MIIEAIMLGTLGYFHSWPVAIIVGVLILFRRWPWLANQIAAMLQLDAYDGMTAWLARHALPAWASARSVMSRSEGMSAQTAPHGDTCINTSIPDTKAIPPADRDIMLDQWLVAMTLAMDDRGKELFTATKIAAAIGGNHNQTMTRIREVRTGKAAQFRQDDGSTAPAEYPVTKSA